MVKNIQNYLNQSENALRGYALTLTQNEVDAADLYQDTILRIILNIDSFQAGTNFRGWSTAVMRNVFINDYRKRSRRKNIMKDVIFNKHTLVNSQFLENEGEINIAYEEILTMIQTLKEEIRLPFWKRYEGYQYDEIATHFDIPVGTAKSRIFFARKKLRLMYEAKIG